MDQPTLQEWKIASAPPFPSGEAGMGSLCWCCDSCPWGPPHSARVWESVIWDISGVAQTPRLWAHFRSVSEILSVILSEMLPDTLSHTLWTNTGLSCSLANHPCQCPHIPMCQRHPVAERKDRFWSCADLCVNFLHHFLDGWSSGSHFTYQSLYFLIYRKPKYQSCRDSKRMKQDWLYLKRIIYFLTYNKYPINNFYYLEHKMLPSNYLIVIK